MTNEDIPAYVARKSCGCIFAAVADDPNHSADTANEVAKWISEGFAVDRVTAQYVRENFVGWHCPHEPRQLALGESE